jgi:hypothetical protein
MLAAIYSFDCEMILKKGNITLNQRKARTRHRYHRSGNKKPSKRKTISDEPVIYTPERPDLLDVDRK